MHVLGAVKMCHEIESNLEMSVTIQKSKPFYHQNNLITLLLIYITMV